MGSRLTSSGKQSVAIYQDQKASGTDGGASIAGTQTRTLNTEVSDDDNIGSLSSNAVTLEAGEYEVLAFVPNMRAVYCKAFLNDGTSDIIEGTTSYTPDTTGGNSIVCVLQGKFTADGVKAYSIRNYTQKARATYGLGIAGSDGSTEVYTTVIFRKIG